MLTLGRKRMKRTEQVSELRTAVIGLLVLVICGGAIACQPDQRIMNSVPQPTPAGQTATVDSTPSTATVEQDVEAMRVADFNFIYVFR